MKKARRRKLESDRHEHTGRANQAGEVWKELRHDPGAEEWNEEAHNQELEQRGCEHDILWNYGTHLCLSMDPASN